MVDIDVDIKYALIKSEKFEDAENNVCEADAMLGLLHERGMISSRKRTVYITETAGFRLLCVMESASPIDGDVAFLAIEARSALHTTTGTDSAKLE